MNYSNFIYRFEFGNCEKEGKKLQKFEYFENEKIFFDKINNLKDYHSVKKLKFDKK